MNKEHICPNFGDFLKKEDFKDITSTFDDLVKWQNEEIQRLKAENEKYKQALEDVREKILFECKRCGKNITSYCEQCWVNSILSKTNEVLKDE